MAICGPQDVKGRNRKRSGEFHYLHRRIAQAVPNMPVIPETGLSVEVANELFAQGQDGIPVEAWNSTTRKKQKRKKNQLAWSSIAVLARKEDKVTREALDEEASE